MKTAHTPAPWSYEKATKTIRAKPSNYWIATMDSWDGAVNHEANAQLIAAAPDLLEACEMLLGRLDENCSGTQYIGDIARAAIQKARGEL